MGEFRSEILLFSLFSLGYFPVYFLENYVLLAQPNAGSLVPAGEVIFFDPLFHGAD